MSKLGTAARKRAKLARRAEREKLAQAEREKLTAALGEDLALYAYSPSATHFRAWWRRELRRNIAKMRAQRQAAQQRRDRLIEWLRRYEEHREQHGQPIARVDRP
ncbi:MAG TPA: hypothetical protein VK741_23710 [Acetobacteraceae bacterium]|nr:hypothetical protein [Acetobacteraceae bacterium]